MVWKLFRQLGLYGGAYAGFMPQDDCSKLPLDPVNCVGVIKLRDLRGSVADRRAALGFCELALNLLLTNDTSGWLDPTHARDDLKRDDRTADKWAEHISTLSTKLTRDVPVKSKDTVHKLLDRWGIFPDEFLKLNPELLPYREKAITVP